MGEVPETGVCELRLGNRAWKEFRLLLWRKCSIGAGLRMLLLGSAVYTALLNRFRMGCGLLRVSSLVLAVFCAGFLALASCGGGGGGNPGPGGGKPGPGGGNPGSGPGPTYRPYRSPPLPSGSPPTAAAFQAYFEAYQEYGENWALDVTGAAAAYARIADDRKARREDVTVDTLAPGKGVVIAVIDSGVDTEHWEFRGALLNEKIVPESGGDGDYPGNGDPYSHGTGVVSVILAQRGSGGGPLYRGQGAKDSRNHNFHGIAWGANVRVFSVPIGVGSARTHTEPIVIDPPASGGYEHGSISHVVGFEKRTDSWVETVLADSSKPEIINMSFGYEGLVDYYYAAARRANSRAALMDVIDHRAQAGREADDRTIIVVAAGNDNGVACALGSHNCVNGQLDASSPTIGAGLQVFFPDDLGHLVTAVSVDRHGDIAASSNRCGLVAKWCLAAPGEGILLAWFKPGPPAQVDTSDRAYQRSGGTSYAAPHVVGGIAVLMHRFPDLGNDEILIRLYTTADKTGKYAPDQVTGNCPAHLNTDRDSDCELSSIYGQGLMDLDAATMPLGMMTIALGDTLHDRRMPAASSGFRGGPAFGNALATGLREHTIAVFDELDAPFRVSLDQFAEPGAGPAIGTRLARFLEPDTEVYEIGGSVRAAIKPGAAGGLVDIPFASTRLRFGVNHPGEGPGSAWATGHASLVPLSDGGASLTLGDGALQFSAFAASPKFSDAGQGPPQTAGAMLSWNPANGPLGFRVAALHEFESSLGLEAKGAFGGLASDLAFAGVGLQAEAGGWEWSAAAEFGRSTPKVSPGSVREVSGLSSSAFAVSGERGFQGGGRLSLSAAWPLRVDSGRLRLKVASGRDKQRNVRYESVRTSLAPSGRQVDLGADWRQLLGVEGGELRLGAVLSLEPGHEAGRSPELALMAGYRLSF